MPPSSSPDCPPPLLPSFSLHCGPSQPPSRDLAETKDVKSEVEIRLAEAEELVERTTRKLVMTEQVGIGIGMERLRSG
jgi:hypothetical protein